MSNKKKQKKKQKKTWTAWKTIAQDRFKSSKKVWLLGNKRRIKTFELYWANNMTYYYYECVYYTWASLFQSCCL